MTDGRAVATLVDKHGAGVDHGGDITGTARILVLLPNASEAVESIKDLNVVTLYITVGD